MKIDRVLSHALQDAIAYVDGACHEATDRSLKPSELKELAELRARRQEYVRLLAKLCPQQTQNPAPRMKWQQVGE